MNKFDGPRCSWKDSKVFMHKHNRHNAKQALRQGEDIMPVEKNLTYWDYEFCKFYFTKEEIKEDFRIMRK